MASEIAVARARQGLPVSACRHGEGGTNSAVMPVACWHVSGLVLHAFTDNSYGRLSLAAVDHSGINRDESTLT